MPMTGKTSYQGAAPGLKGKTISDAVPPACLLSEIRALLPDQKLATGKDMDVYLASAQQIPQTLQEIGRLREITFRAVGEGTGKAVDIDRFDRFYLHLFLWDHHNHRIAGAYRLGLTDKILNRHGKLGLYSQSLFELHDRFLDTLSPAIELGRSFVAHQYQKTIAPLALLWKAIGCFIARNPQYATLFGPVSISNNYCPLSRQLLVDFFDNNNPDDPLRKFVKARHPYRPEAQPRCNRPDLATPASFKELSELIAAIEKDGKAVPVLLRHYVNFGGRILGFSVDKKFANCLDGLVLVELCQTDERILGRYMGNEGLARFKQYHARTLALTA